VRTLLRTLYAAAAQLARVAANVAPARKGKLAAAMRARRGIRERYRAWGRQRDSARRLLWMHAPSVGEGLMARPVLSLLKSRHPDLMLAYTFFSPSAETFARKLDVDFRDYLPFDTAGDTSAALDALAPRALVFSKLDVWPELVRQSKRRGVRIGLISATVAPGSSRLGGVASALLRDAYAALDAVGAVDDDDAGRLERLGVRHDVIEITGDTRYDQVLQRVRAVDPTSPLLSGYRDARPTLVAGSTWPADETPLLAAIARLRQRHPGFRLIIAPHEPTPSHLEPVIRWARRSGSSVARVDDQDAGAADVVLVDRVGVLADLYSIADAAFVGGGFHDAGLHSVVEPAAFAVPVLFGPRHLDSRDALLLLAARGARAARDSAGIEHELEGWFGDPQARHAAGARAREVVERGRGASERSARLVERLLTYER
jgi:3-deoxy-D-manno-octulosonic-acid transferase